ncbi:MAG: cell wall hydrolase [Egibacteraceae bacterium]
MLRSIYIVLASAAIVGIVLPAAIEYRRQQAAEAAIDRSWENVDTWAGLSTPARVDRNPKRDEAKTCLALNTYYEARGEEYAGQVAVGQVALRRAGLDFRKVCREIYRPGQFTWTATRPQGSALPRGVAWQWALAAAEESLRWAARPEEFSDYSNGATHFHAHYVKPRWAHSMVRVTVLGAHLFYAKEWGL